MGMVTCIFIVFNLLHIELGKIISKNIIKIGS